MKLSDHAPPGVRPEERTRFPMLLVLKALVNALDHAMRQAR